MFTVGLLAILVICIALAQPLYVIIGSVASYLLLAGGYVDGFEGLTRVVELTRKLSDNEVLLAIPFFVISGGLMSEGAIARRLIAVARTMFGWLPGGLSIAAVAACVFFAAISGSSPVTVIAIGSIMYPAMVKEGYTKRFAAGLVTTAGSLGILIPPSIPMVIYTIIDPTAFADPPNYNFADESGNLGLVDLFLAGVGPGLFIAAIFGGYALFNGVRSKIPTEPFSFKAFFHAFREGFWSLMLPVIILGGIYSGLFTPTNAAAVSVVYALVVELFIHRSIKIDDLRRILGESTVLIGSLLIILALSQGLSEYLEEANVAERVVELLTEWQLSPIAFLLLVNLLLLVVGCFMDIMSAIVIFVPLLSPVALELGIHPVHLAIIFIVNLEIGYMTPPLGLNLFVATTIFREKLGEIIRSVIPFVGQMLIALMFITYVPSISLGLVSVYRGGSFFVPFPERHIPLDTLEVPDTLKFLAGIAALEEQAGGAEADAAPVDPGRPLTMAEMMERSRQTREAEAMDSLTYATPQELLADYRRLYGRTVTLRNLSVERDLGIAPEDGSGAEAEGSAAAEGSAN